MKSLKMKLEKHKHGSDLCLNAMKHLADHHHSRSYPDIGQKDWGDYLALRILDALFHLNSILKESQAVPVSWEFKKV